MKYRILTRSCIKLFDCICRYEIYAKVADIKEFRPQQIFEMFYKGQGHWKANPEFCDALLALDLLEIVDWTRSGNGARDSWDHISIDLAFDFIKSLNLSYISWLHMIDHMLEEQHYFRNGNNSNIRVIRHELGKPLRSLDSYVISRNKDGRYDFPNIAPWNKMKECRCVIS